MLEYKIDDSNHWARANRPLYFTKIDYFPKLDGTPARLFVLLPIGTLGLLTLLPDMASFQLAPWVYFLIVTVTD